MAKITLPSTGKLNILLADDDQTDCLLFKEALEELPILSHLTTINNGEELMKHLRKRGNKLPDVLFLDINMPKKNGYASLAEIKSHARLEKIPVIIFSTASEQQMESIKINQVFKDAAHYYIRKPNTFSELKRVIHKVLTPILEKNISLPYVKENFVITGDLKSISDEIKATPRKGSHRKIN